MLPAACLFQFDGGRLAGYGERPADADPAKDWWIYLGAVVAVFAAVNLVLSLSTFRGEQPVERTMQELQVLWFSPVDGRPMSPSAFSAVHGRDLGRAPDSAAIHAFLEKEAEDGVFLLDQVMIDRILGLNGRIDARAIPSGVYVGAHALVPDGLPQHVLVGGDLDGHRSDDRRRAGCVEEAVALRVRHFRARRIEPRDLIWTELQLHCGDELA